jgi:hypothetical protein
MECLEYGNELMLIAIKYKAKFRSTFAGKDAKKHTRTQTRTSGLVRRRWQRLLDKTWRVLKGSM